MCSFLGYCGGGAYGLWNKLSYREILRENPERDATETPRYALGECGVCVSQTVISTQEGQSDKTVVVGLVGCR